MANKKNKKYMSKSEYIKNKMEKEEEKNKEKEPVNFFANLFELPKELIHDLPLISIVGNCEVIVENYKSLLEYSDEVIRINTSSGVFVISGKKLILKQMTNIQLNIVGVISCANYI